MPTRTRAADSSPATPVPDQPVDASADVDPDVALEALVADYPDGSVTFTRPGVDSLTVQVKDGRISTTKERQAWLLQHAVGVSAPTE